MEQKLLDRITLNPEVCHGKPTVRNTRHMVEGILEYLSAGDSPEDIMTEFSDLTKEDILACIAYATEVLKFKGLTFSSVA